MPLENAQYIPELVPTNPLGVDAVNLGDNHLRVIKTAVLGSFPAFVGTQATPKFVTLTEDEINTLIDAALKAGAATITGLWDFTTQPTYNGDVIGTEAFATAADLVLQNLLQRPANRALAAAGSVLQADQGEAIRYTGAAAALDIPVLLDQTQVTVKNVGSGALTLTENATTLSWLQGGAIVTGNRLLAPGSVCELHYTSINTVEVWGNGLS